MIKLSKSTFVLLAFVMILGGGQWLRGWDWRGVKERYQLLQAVDFSRANIDGIIALRGRERNGMVSGLNNGCAAIWKSRILAGYNPAMAEKALAEAEGCRRDELYYAWRGNLAWLRGEREEAIREWSKLKRYEILTLGRSSLLAGDAQRAAVLFGILLRRNDIGKQRVDQMAFFEGLASAYQQMGDWETSARYYREAWELDGRSYTYSYLLGDAYRLIGRCLDAITVFEIGLSNQRKRPYPDQEFFYHYFMGECYSQIGKPDPAVVQFLTARQVLENYQNELPTEFVESYIKVLQYKLNSIENK